MPVSDPWWWHQVRQDKSLQEVVGGCDGKEKNLSDNQNQTWPALYVSSTYKEVGQENALRKDARM
jgi:hypothetical protein